ncbi:uncharacterized protein LOC144122159 isoform X2 [Amblyomma americanum]
MHLTLKSGLGSSTSDTMVNPFCFVVQVLASLLQMQAPRTCAEEGIAIQRLVIDVSARDIDCPVDNIFQPHIVATTPAPASVTSHHRLPPAGIRSSSLAFGISVLGSSTSDTMVNPFCFVVQVLVGLFQVQPPVFCLPGLSAVIADINNDLLARADVTSVNRIIEPAARISAHAPTSGTAEHVVHQAFKRSPASAFIFSGLGSSASETMFRSHFCFILQDRHALEYAAWSPSEFAQRGAASHPSDW